LAGPRGADSIAFAPYTSTLATHHFDTTILWDVRTNKPVASFRVGSGPLLFVEDGQYLLAGLTLYEPLSGRGRRSLGVRNDPLGPRDRNPGVLACTSSPADRLTMLLTGQPWIHLF